jgi:hypothetical protein
MGPQPVQNISIGGRGGREVGESEYQASVDAGFAPKDPPKKAGMFDRLVDAASRVTRVVADPANLTEAILEVDPGLIDFYHGSDPVGTMVKDLYEALGGKGTGNASVDRVLGFVAAPGASTAETAIEASGGTVPENPYPIEPEYGDIPPATNTAPKLDTTPAPAATPTAPATPAAPAVDPAWAQPANSLANPAFTEKEWGSRGSKVADEWLGGAKSTSEGYQKQWGDFQTGFGSAFNTSEVDNQWNAGKGFFSAGQTENEKGADNTYRNIKPRTDSMLDTSTRRIANDTGNTKKAMDSSEGYFGGNTMGDAWRSGV